MHYDVFNGDADGICALIQLRLDQPRQAELVTGVKRDISLLEKITANAGDSLTVLDISLQKNHRRVVEFLAAGASIFYADHHQAGEIPVHPNLQTIIDTNSSVCTSLLVNDYLNNKYSLWAVTAAFGDNLANSAENLAATLALSAEQAGVLKKLGVYINYNSYGNTINDLYFAPANLYQDMARYTSPFDFIADSNEIYQKLETGYQQDMANAETVKPEYQSNAVAVYVLPDAAWARRISGVFGNNLVNKNNALAYAVLSENADGGYTVSVRSPINSKLGADEFCAGFATGGGRKSAAGINHLPVSQLNEFITRFERYYAVSN